MKIVKIIFSVILLATSFVSCKKDTKKENPAYTCTTCKTTPEANASNDASNKGIYKGVIIGSSGTIMFNLQNNGTAITAIMVIDGTTVNLTSTVSIIAGQTYVSPFTGTLNGQSVSLAFSVGATGQNPAVTASNIPGHANSTFSIIKETASSLVECFEGTYSTTKPETGIFNLILSRNLKVFSGASRKDGSTASNAFNGTINAYNELIDASSNKSIVTLTGDNLASTFVDGSGSTVTVKGKRTF